MYLTKYDFDDKSIDEVIRNGVQKFYESHLSQIDNIRLTEKVLLWLHSIGIIDIVMDLEYYSIYVDAYSVSIDIPYDIDMLEQIYVILEDNGYKYDDVYDSSTGGARTWSFKRTEINDKSIYIRVELNASLNGSKCELITYKTTKEVLKYRINCGENV